MRIPVIRSPEYVRARRLATGSNIPDQVSADVEVAQLGEQVRSLLLDGNRGCYPESLQILMSREGLVGDYMYTSVSEVHADIEAEALTPALASALIGQAIEAKRAELAAQTVREEEARAAQEAAEAEQCEIERAAIAAFLADPEARPTRRDSGEPLWIALGDVRVRVGSDRYPEFRAEALRREAADQEAALTTLRTWAETHGSERLRQMLALQVGDWVDVAEDEYIAAHTPEGYDIETYRCGDDSERRKPQLVELQELARLRELVAASDDVLSDPGIYWHVVEDREDDDGDVEPGERFAATHVTVRAPNGTSRTVARRIG